MPNRLSTGRLTVIVGKIRKRLGRAHAKAGIKPGGFLIKAVKHPPYMAVAIRQHFIHTLANRFRGQNAGVPDISASFVKWSDVMG